MSGHRAGNDRPGPGDRSSPSSPRERAVAARLRRLDPTAGRRLVADLWAARGYEIRYPGDSASHGTGGTDGTSEASSGFVEATQDGERETVGVVSPPRLGSPSLPDPVPDVVVVLGDPESVTGGLGEGTRILAAADLAEMLLYAVDRGVAVDLCDRHLGAPPDRLRLPVSVAVRRRLGSLGIPSPSVASGLRVAGVGLAVLIVAVGLAALGGSDASGPATPETALDAAASGAGQPGEAAAAGPADDAGEFPETYPPGTADLLPPGVTQEGINDTGSLARAHSQRLTERSYALTLARHQPANGSAGPQPANGSAGPADPSLDRYLFGSLPQPGVTHTTGFAVEGDAYRSRVTIGNDDGARVRASVYFTDGEWYVAAPLYGNSSYRSVPVGESVGPVPNTLREELVDRYLSTPETELTGTVEADGRRLYRVAANGTPRPFPDPFIRNYTAVALVDSRGVVHDLSVSYAIVSDDERATVETSVSYGSFGEVVVRPPPWYINRFDER